MRLPDSVALARDDVQIPAVLRERQQLLGIWKNYVNVRMSVPVTKAVVAPRRIAVDDKYVYWTDQGFIGRVPK